MKNKDHPEISTADTLASPTHIFGNKNILRSLSFLPLLSYIETTSLYIKL